MNLKLKLSNKMAAVEHSDKIKIFIPTDENLKQLGELLMTETSRSIILELIGKEMYVNELAIKLGLRVSLVTHHLQKLKDLGLLDITSKPISKRTKPHDFFRFKTDIFLNFSEDTTGGKLKRIFKESVKFASIGIASATSFLIDYPTSRTDNYATGFVPDNPLEPWVVFLTGIIIGLVIERLYFGWKKSKRKN